MANRNDLELDLESILLWLGRSCSSSTGLLMTTPLSHLLASLMASFSASLSREGSDPWDPGFRTPMAKVLGRGAEAEESMGRPFAPLFV